MRFSLLLPRVMIFVVILFTSQEILGVENDLARPNILIVTVDDMNCDSVGAFGCELAGTTPNIDQLAARGMRYQFAHVQVGNCYPSRNVMFSGRYPHNTGVEGFYQVKDPDYPHLVDAMKAGGYFVGIRGKASHSTPYQPYAWDADLSTIDGKKQDVKNAQSYYVSTRRGIEMAKAAGKPFCLNVNISDPHKPFFGISSKGKLVDDKNAPSHVFDPSEVPIPGFLFDHPDVRLELAHYYSSVRRADDCFAATMKALNESGQANNTVIMFLSDHGMPLPFAKTALWHHSTHTPWIVCWPGVTQPGYVDREHMISAVDLMPTVLEIAGLKAPDGFDGHSFLPTIHGERQDNREAVYKVYNENSGGNRSPMRSVETKKYGYLFNPWVDGKRIFATATKGTLSYRAMQKMAATDPKIAVRLDLFDHGVREELYDYEIDPDALNNLIDDPKYAEVLTKLRGTMRRFMTESKDPVLEVFDQREDDANVTAYVDRVQAVSDERRQRRRKQQPPKSQRKQNTKLFDLQLPESVHRGRAFEVVIDHKLTKKLGQQDFHVTLKDDQGKRIDRRVVSASGNGSLKVLFELPDDFESSAIMVAAFVGKDYQSNLLYKTNGPVTVAK
ncbi:MAG: sulfatase family protein [Pirellulales bacterium]|jgi:N-sulfoglucosamine sulfohydrolase